MAAVFDTNVLVSAVLLRNSIPYRAFALAEQLGGFLTTISLLAEFDGVLRRSKFDAYVSVASRQIFFLRFAANARVLNPPQQAELARDPNDAVLLDLAAAGGASAIVTGDDDLLSLGSFERIPIVGPREFLDRYANTST